MNKTKHGHGIFFFFSLTLLTFAGCTDLLSPPKGGPEAGPNSLVVRIGGAERTALPAAVTSYYTISVTRPSPFEVLGSRTNIPPGENAVIPLSSPPEVGDKVLVEGFTSGDVKTAEGLLVLAAGDLGHPITVTMKGPAAGAPMTASGSVNLSIGFPVFDPATEITAAEISLYASLADYQAGKAYLFRRYVKDVSYGAGTAFSAGPSLALIETLSSGNYVAKVEFFRGKFTKIKTLIETILVRDNLVTSSWNGGGSTLTLDTGAFASSNANLAGISIGGSPVGLLPDTYSYSVLKEWTGAETPTLTITPGVSGQKIEAKLNGTAVSGTLSGLNRGSNSLVITVTAPDGVSTQTYAVSFTYRHGTVWYVSTSGDDSDGLSSSTAFNTVGKALDAIKNAYTGTWEGKNSDPVPALIQISGTINTETDSAYTDANNFIKIHDSGSVYATLPPIILAGNGSGVISASGKTALSIERSAVILGDNLTITGGKSGVRLFLNSKFTMNGGTISGSTSDLDYGGGGVFANTSTFTMNGGTIIGNTTSGYGGGVRIANNSTSFIMNGGTISGNNANGTGSGGGGVYSAGSFTMNGGTITGNGTEGSGGGMYATGTGAFTMNGGTISLNTAANNTLTDSSGGVHIDNSTFIMNGGTISGNTTSRYGGGVHIDNSAFTMNGGTISGNSSGSGGGVYFASGSFNMPPGSTGTISGNTANDSGGGVYINGSAFTMPAGSTGTIGGNTAGNDGGGVYVTGSGGTFTMNGGTISGNRAADNGGGAAAAGGGSFTMNSGSVISGNSSNSDGGGVAVLDTGTGFTMTGGIISGNTITGGGSGGGVHINGGTFIMNSGSVISRNNTNSNGGGVYIYYNGAFTMNGGSVENNTVTGGGGGVYISDIGNNTKFTMSGGTVSGNTANGGGDGVYVGYTGTGTFTMSGSAAVDTGNKVYLNTGRVITLSGDLSADPAANIHLNFPSGTQLLSGDITDGTPQNYTLFQVDGEANKIDASGHYAP